MLHRRKPGYKLPYFMCVSLKMDASAKDVIECIEGYSRSFTGAPIEDQPWIRLPCKFSYNDIIIVKYGVGRVRW